MTSNMTEATKKMKKLIGLSSKKKEVNWLRTNAFTFALTASEYD